MHHWKSSLVIKCLSLYPNISTILKQFLNNSWNRIHEYVRKEFYFKFNWLLISMPRILHQNRFPNHVYVHVFIKFMPKRFKFTRNTFFTSSEIRFLRFIFASSKWESARMRSTITFFVSVNGALSLLFHHRQNGEPLVSAGVGFDRSSIESTHQG